MVAENRGVDRFGDEIRSAVLIGLRDGMCVIQSREDQNRDAFAARKRAKPGTGQIPVHVRHHNIQDDQIRCQCLEFHQRILPSGGLGHGHAGRFQCVPNKEP